MSSICLRCIAARPSVRMARSPCRPSARSLPTGSRRTSCRSAAKQLIEKNVVRDPNVAIAIAEYRPVFVDGESGSRVITATALT